MASGMCTFLKENIVNALLRSDEFIKPASIFVALFTSQPSADGSGDEVSAASYARVEIAPSNTNWAALENAQTKNTTAIVFADPQESWGTVTHFALFDAAAEGNMLAFGELTSSLLIDESLTAPTFSPEKLTITLT